MPQLDVSTFASQILWLVITFVPLYLIVVRVALPRIGEVIEARRDKIDDDLKKAAARRDEAQAVLAEYEALQAESQAKAQALLKQAKDEMAAEAAQQHAELAAKLAEQTMAAEARINAAKAEALTNLEQAVIEVASAATTKLLGVTPSQEEVSAAVRSAMTKEG
jgi:F-type H+-transporting ATPase subunit b